ncbi:MAG: tRNA lysidine(34) synthetase TilS [Patescibacteria group bacterium]|nr:tRNA lysidine(34) synthetase TilS [Patescibacteria group bacterium]
MDKNLKKVIEKYELSKKKLILAVSGGVDSVVLLDLFACLLPKSNLFVAHVNHGLRKEADKDEAFALDLAGSYGIKFYSKKLKLVKKDEGTARAARYDYLLGLRDELGADYIVTAHHANDQLETILLNLTRGAGPVELWGMKELSGPILRPLLGNTREDILAYAKKKKLKYVLDETNNDTTYSRNLIRHKVVPELLRINPSLLSGISNNSKVAGELREYLDDELSRYDSEKVLISSLLSMPPFLARELIKRNLQTLIGYKGNIYAKNIEAVYELLTKKGEKKTEIKGKVIEKSGKYLIFGTIEPKKERAKRLVIGRKIIFGGHTIICKLDRSAPREDNILLPASFSDKLKVRTWQSGDKIVTPSGTKKVQDIFTDAKIPRRKRVSWPIVVAGEEILWLPLLASSRVAYGAKNKVADDKKYLTIEVK